MFVHVFFFICNYCMFLLYYGLVIVLNSNMMVDTQNYTVCDVPIQRSKVLQRLNK